LPSRLPLPQLRPPGRPTADTPVSQRSGSETDNGRIVAESSPASFAYEDYRCNAITSAGGRGGVSLLL